jgi:hypothetical protein
LGLAPKKDPKSSHENYGEYLKRRKLVSANTLAIQLFEYYQRIIYGAYNRTAVQADIIPSLSSDYYPFSMFAKSNGMKFNQTILNYNGAFGMNPMNK